MLYDFQHNTSRSRYELISNEPESRGQVIAHVEYATNDNDITIVRVYTNPEYRGSGWAAKVTEYAIREIEKQHTNWIPACPYARWWSDIRLSLTSVEWNEMGFESLPE